MFPYIQIPPIRFGPGILYPFPILVVMGILVGYWTMLRRARRAGLDGGRAAALCLWAVVPGLLGAHFFKALYYPETLALGALFTFRGVASFGGIIGGLVGTTLFFRQQRIKLPEAWRYMDALAYSFLCGWVFGRLGCFVAHDHPGIRSESWLAVQYPNGSRYDLGLIEVFFTLFLLAAFRFLDRIPTPAGTYLGVIMVLYPVFRLWLDTLHVTAPAYWGITVDRFASMVCFAAGLAIFGMIRAAARDTLVSP